MPFSSGEWTAIGTSITAIAYAMIAQWAANAKADRAAQDVTNLRVQDRLDRESLARQVYERQQLELKLLEAKTHASEVALQLQLSKTQANEVALQQQMVRSEAATKAHRNNVMQVLTETKNAVAENTQITKAGVAKSEEAYQAANNVNAKIAAIGLSLNGSEVKEQQGRIENTVNENKEQQGRIENTVLETNEKMEQVRQRIIDEPHPKDNGTPAR